MAFTYKKDAQDKHGPVEFDALIKIDKERRYLIDSKKSGEYVFRVLMPWSIEGIFAPSFKVHYLNKKPYLCPTMIGANCDFCNTHREIRSDPQYEADTRDVRPSYRYLMNVGDVREPTSIAKVLEVGPQIYGPIKTAQDTGFYGDILDGTNGHNVYLKRTVQGKVADQILVDPKPSKLANPEWENQLLDLCGLIPEVDEEIIKSLYASHPWKVYEPNPTHRVVSAPVKTQPTVGLPPQVPTTTLVQQPAATETLSNNEDQVADLMARLKAKQAGK